MTWVDGAMLVIIVLSAAFSMIRGFVREVLGVGAWIGAGLAAVNFYGMILPEINGVMPASAKGFGIYVAMAVVFIVVLIVLSLISALIGGMVRDSALSGLDRSLGLVFGAVRGAVIVCLAYIALSVGVAQAQWPPPVVNARFLPMAHQGAVALTGLLPPEYRPIVKPLPASPVPSAGALMQEPVSGNALGNK